MAQLTQPKIGPAQKWKKLAQTKFGPAKNGPDKFWPSN